MNSEETKYGIKHVLKSIGLIRIGKKIYRELGSILSPIEFYLLKIIGYFPSHHIRNLIYHASGMQIGKGSHIYSGAEIRNQFGIKIGKGTSIGHNAILDGRGGLVIGNSVNFSSGVWIWTVEHSITSANFEGVSAPVKIEDYVWLSCRVTVLPGVTIGEGAVACAGAVVTKNVEPYAIVAGVPAKKIGERPRGLTYELSKYIHMI